MTWGMLDAIATMPGLSGHSARIVLAEGHHELADGLRRALQSYGRSNDLAVIAVDSSDPAAWAASSPDIMIVDPARSPWQSEQLAEILRSLLPETALIASCCGTDAAQARSLLRQGFRAVIPKAPEYDALARIVLTVACGGVCLQDVDCAPKGPAAGLSTSRLGGQPWQRRRPEAPDLLASWHPQSRH